jgi:hypothetical protein
VDDVPGHQVRLFEIRRTYPSNAPAINGMKIVESADFAATDYIDNNGAAITYWVYVLENGDKFLPEGRWLRCMARESNLTATTVGPIMGGTGKLSIQGMARTLTTADPKAGKRDASRNRILPCTIGQFCGWQAGRTEMRWTVEGSTARMAFSVALMLLSPNSSRPCGQAGTRKL